MTKKRSLKEKLKTLKEVRTAIVGKGVHTSDVIGVLDELEINWTKALQKETKRKEKQDLVVSSAKKKKKK